VGGRLPELDVTAHVAVCELVRGLVAADLVAGVHDVSDGGLGVALAEMAVGSGVGFRVAGLAGHAQLFSEAPSRVVACVTPDRVDAVVDRAVAAGVGVTLLGSAGGDRLVFDGLVDLSLPEAREAWRQALPAALGA
jgi:phosphoribosylformylglycinamidine synthase